MSDEINVISRTQQIFVEPSSASVAVINAGPYGGPPGPTGPAGPAGQGITPARIQKRRSTTNLSITLASYTNWADLSNADFQTAIAAKVGDELQLTLDGAWITVAGGIGFLDAYILQSGSSFGSSTGGAATGNGTPGWGGHAIAGDDPFNGSTWRTIVAGDISGGQVTVRLRARATGSNQSIKADPSSPLTLNILNFPKLP